MKNKFLHLLAVSTIGLLVLSGCTGNEVAPNNATQTGAVTGALAGSVIGYNSGSHSGRNAVIGGLLGAATFLITVTLFTTHGANEFGTVHIIVEIHCITPCRSRSIRSVFYVGIVLHLYP